MRFSVALPRNRKPLAAVMLRKYSRLRRPGGLRREYKKLRSLLPGATRSRQLRKKVGVVEAAYQYICELQAALLDKFSTKGIPEDLAGIVRGKVATASDIQALALHLISNSPSINNNNNFMNSSYLNSVPSIRQSLPQINTEKSLPEIPLTPKTNASVSQAKASFISQDFPSSSAVSHRTVYDGCSQNPSPCDNSSHIIVDSFTYQVDKEVPLLSKNISDISLSKNEEELSTSNDGTSSSSTSTPCIHPQLSPTIEK